VEKLENGFVTGEKKIAPENTNITVCGIFFIHLLGPSYLGKLNLTIYKNGAKI
jgi:hypothetical protein